MKKMDWSSADVHRLVAFGLSEDQAKSDITTQALIKPGWRVDAVIRAKQTGVVAGLPLVHLYFKTFDRRCRVRSSSQ